MLHLLTGNPRKYAALSDLLARLQIELRSSQAVPLELQDDDFRAVVAHKSRWAARTLGRPCLVDDSGLLLDAYPEFPGPLTGAVCRHLGAAGLQRLLTGTTARARMVCHLGCWVQDELWHWQGEVAGQLDLRRPTGEGPGPLTQWFVPDEGTVPFGPTSPDEPVAAAVFLHRRRALEALEPDIDWLRQAVGLAPRTPERPIPENPECVFCQEFAGQTSSVYHRLLGAEIPSRILHRTQHFLVFPPLGEFIEGGLLIATRGHHLSMAHLPESHYAQLETLMAETCDLLARLYGCQPLFFEHAPVCTGDKGTCCVDHAHLNVFPAEVDVHRQLEKFPHRPIADIRELAAMGRCGQAYLFLQDNRQRRFVYETGVVPSQYIRQLVTAGLGMPERWHWREYLGLDELKRTLAKLAGWRSAHAPLG